jgi:hypothetical protein
VWALEGWQLATNDGFTTMKTIRQMPLCNFTLTGKHEFKEKIIWQGLAIDPVSKTVRDKCKVVQFCRYCDLVDDRKPKTIYL